MRTVIVRALSDSLRSSAAARPTSSVSSPSMSRSSCRSVSNVSSRLMLFATSRSTTSASSTPRTRSASQAASRGPTRRTRAASSSASTSSTRRRPASANRADDLGPMPGISASASCRMKASSSPGSTTCTPSAPVPGFGFARSTASLATSFEVPPPRETERPVAARTSLRIRCATACERSAAVQPVHPAEIEIPFVDRCGLDGRGEPFQDVPDLAMLHAASASGNRDAQRVGAEAERARDRHGRSDAELPRLVRRRADHPPAARRAADDEQGGLAGTLRVHQARDGHEERIGVREQDAARARGLGGHAPKIPGRSVDARGVRASTPSVDYAYAATYLTSLSKNAFGGGRDPGCITHR